MEGAPTDGISRQSAAFSSQSADFSNRSAAVQQLNSCTAAEEPRSAPDEIGEGILMDINAANWVRVLAATSQTSFFLALFDAFDVHWNVYILIGGCICMPLQEETFTILMDPIRQVVQPARFFSLEKLARPSLYHPASSPPAHP